jgi:hypothetical protein
MTLRFDATNESLDAVIAGLNPKQGDNILAVLGSGDQACAMVAEGAKVYGVDINPDQVRYAGDRKGYVEKGDFASFLGTISGSNVHSHEYFKANNRLEKLAANMHNLTIAEGSVLDENLLRAGFNKIYLSNVISYMHIHKFGDSKRTEFAHYNFVMALNKIAESIPAGCLVYVSDSHFIFSDKVIKKYGLNKITQSAKLEKDEILSAEADKLEPKSGTCWDWHPAVYRRAA